MSTIEIKNLVLYKVNQQRHAKEKYVPLIKNLNATFESGKINAIMGPNGSSKTTLMDIVYGMCEPSTKTSGSILYNGKERNANEWFSNVSYSEQDCCAIEDQTVQEAIQFSVDLHLADKGKDERSSEENIGELIKHLQLEKVLDSKISVISGGERKRTMMAIEMVMGKKILILDEPTSDLDSHLAYKVTKYLKDLAVRHDLMVIMTVHQPGPQLFSLFDNFLFMYKGMQVYNGQVCNIVKTMSSKGIVQPESWTTAEFLFEAFSETSSFENIEALRPRVNGYIEELDGIWHQNLEKLYKKNEAVRYGGFNAKHVWVIAKRQFLRDLRSKHFLIWMVSMVIFKSSIIFNALKDSQVVSSDTVSTTNLISIMLILFEISKSSYFFLCPNSTFATKKQISKEIAKSFYTPLSLCVSTIALEIVSNLTDSAITLLGVTIFNSKIVTIYPITMVLCQAMFIFPTVLLIRLVMSKISEVNAILASCLVPLMAPFCTIQACGYPVTFLISFLPKFKIGFHILSWMIFSLSPAHLMDLFIMSSFENKIVDEIFGGDRSASGSILTTTVGLATSSLTGKTNINPKWFLGGFFASLLLTIPLLLSFFVFCFSPQIRLRMSQK